MRVLSTFAMIAALTTLPGCPGQIGEPDDDDTTTGEVEGDEAGECDDGVDNDQDGYADCEDSGCADAVMCVDADGDGWTVEDGDCDDDDPGVYPSADEIPCDEVDNDCDPDTGDEPDEDGDGFTACEDCDDGDPDVHPDATEETCDGADNDCDPATEDAPDGDGDGWSLCEDCDDGDPSVSPGAEEQTCDGVDNDCDPATEDAPDGDGDGHASCADCDDGNADVYPGAYEECDGLDTDCDGSIPLGELDNDGDGYVSCGGPLGDPDCDDLDPNIYPGATELCDGADGDCDGQLPGDEADADADGWMDCDGDCDDLDPLQYPGADEYCNAEDDDCDGTVDEDDALDVAVWYEDTDGDGYGEPATVDVDCVQPQGFADNGLDCDDGDAAVHPGTDEVPCDGVDNDCDPTTLDGEDADGDGHDECSDCDESDGETYPGATELCDGVDNDCDGTVPVDEDDGDGDGWRICGGDCDDSDVTTYPAAPELCDNVDNDCDGTLDDGVADDLDGDGLSACDGDCDDGDADTHPGAAEVCDGIDNDCDGALPGDEADLDGDGWSTCDGDCDDGNDSMSPGAVEVCEDGIDSDCDGIDPLCLYEDAWALDFDGADDYVDLGDHADFDQLSDELTIEAMIWPDAGASAYSKPILSKRLRLSGVGETTGFGLYYWSFADANQHSVKVTLNTDAGSHHEYSSSGGIVPQEWTHVTTVYDGTSVLVYLDGQLDTQAIVTGAIQPNDDPLEIGSRSDAGGYFFDGLISQVRLWNRALEASEVEQQFLLPGSVDPAGLIGDWHIESGAGTLLLDSSVQGHDGTIHGATWSPI